MRSFWLYWCLVLGVWSSLPTAAQAQVRLIQYTDAHSTIETLPHQLKAIDLACHEFKKMNPKGECVIFIIGDFTSLDPLSKEDAGFTSIRALKILRARGHTVLFTPGNHDAFDWSDQIDGADLFIAQMKELHEMGVILLGANFVGLKSPLDHLFQESYELRSLRPKSALVGLTIPLLKRKSNLYEKTARKIFSDVESYEETFHRLLPELDSRGFQKIFLGVHQGHDRLRAQVGKIHKLRTQKGLAVDVPLMMAAHDHYITAFRDKGVLISDAGWRGSFNVIDIDRDGNIQTPIHHVFLPHQNLENVKSELFQLGRLHENSISKKEIELDPAFQTLSQNINHQLKTKLSELKKTILRIKGIPYTRDDLKTGPNHLGHLLSEALVEWSDTSSIKEANSIPTLAMTNSSTYHYSEPLRPGSLNELMIRSMYPYLAHAKLFDVSGAEANLLYQSLREHFVFGDITVFSPHLNFSFRENNKQLQYLKNGQWFDLKPSDRVRLAIDGWLAEQFRGEGYQIPTWLEILPKSTVLQSTPYQDVLLGYLPTVIQRFDQGRYRSRHCAQLLQK